MDIIGGAPGLLVLIIFKLEIYQCYYNMWLWSIAQYVIKYINVIVICVYGM